MPSSTAVRPRGAPYAAASASSRPGTAGTAANRPPTPRPPAPPHTPPPRPGPRGPRPKPPIRRRQLPREVAGRGGDRLRRRRRAIVLPRRSERHPGHGGGHDGEGEEERE